MLIELLNKLRNNEISQRSFIVTIKNNNDLINEVIAETQFIETDDILERLYYVINDLHDIVKCKYCDNKAIWTGRLNEGYKEICNDINCRKKQLSDTHKDKNISNNRDNSFIEWQNNVVNVDDNVIKEIKYDRHIGLLTNKHIIDYLKKRFDDSDSIIESYQRIIMGVEHKPVCSVCGRPVNWVGKKSKLYTTYCSNSCAENSDERQRKMKETLIKNWGTEKCYDSEKYKSIMREKYGVDYTWQRTDVQEKRKQSLIEHFGTTKIYQIEEIRNKIIATNRKKFGYDSPFQSPEIRQKMYEVCKENGKLGTSKAEDQIFNWLIELGFNVERFVYSKEFPFTVDFYLTDYNVYIEYQGSQYHNYGAYFGTNDDLKIIEELKQKNEKVIKKTGNETSQYQSIINTWSIFDVKKRNYAKAKGFNYLEIYSCKSKEDLMYQLNFYLMCLMNNNVLFYEKDTLQNEYNSYKKMKCITFNTYINTHNCIIKQFQCNNFFRKEIELFAHDPIIRRKLIQNRIKYLNKKESELTPNDILTGFKKSGIYYGYSHFNPQWTNWFINKYKIKTVYDPCGGWGHHMLGMLSCKKIIYNDFSKSTVEGVQKIKDYFNINNLEIHYGDGTKYEPENVEAWFMCPPYYNLEHYECGDFESVELYKKFLNDIMTLWQKNSAEIFGVIIREDLIQHINLKPDEVFDMHIHKSHLINKSEKKIDEKFYVFKK